MLYVEIFFGVQQTRKIPWGWSTSIQPFCEIYLGCHIFSRFISFQDPRVNSEIQFRSKSHLMKRKFQKSIQDLPIENKNRTWKFQNKLMSCENECHKVCLNFEIFEFSSDNDWFVRRNFFKSKYRIQTQKVGRLTKLGLNFSNPCSSSVSIHFSCNKTPYQVQTQNLAFLVLYHTHHK